MKRTIIAFITGAVLFGTVGVFAGQYAATDNPFPIQLNGHNVSIQGYNIEGSTYFKLRDIADIVGGFDVGFNNDTIQLSQNGYVYDNSSSVSDNPYNNLGYLNVSGRTMSDVAAEADMPLDELLEKYHLPADLPPDTYESAAYNMIPFGVIIEMNGFTGMETVESAKRVLELPDWITYDTPWGEAIDEAPLRAYIGEEYLENFKAYYGLNDTVNGDTLFKEVRRIVDAKEKENVSSSAE